MGTRLAVASVNFYASFTASVFLQVKKQLRPGETLVQCATETQHDSDVARAKLLGLLESDSRPESLILVCVRPGPAVVDAYRRAEVPIILVDEETEGTSTVASDNFASGRMAAEHLLETGRRRLAVVSGRARLPGGYSALHRQRGFRAALDRAGLALAPENVIEVIDYSQHDGVAAMTALLERKEDARPDGVFSAAGDMTAVGLLEAAKARGLKVGRDLAILSSDDLAGASISDPPLTSIRQPVDAIAREAHRLAVDERAAILAQPRQVLLPPSLVRRRSS